MAKYFPAILNWVEQRAIALGGALGRVALVRLAPGGRVYRHVDHGRYYQWRDRYHLVLHSPAGSLLGAGEEWVRMQPGELWWFNNKAPHEACNESDDWRIHLIFDIRHSLVQDKNSVTQVLRYAKPGLQSFCPVPRGGLWNVVP